MQNDLISSAILKAFSHTPTKDQRELINQLSIFIENRRNDNAFLLKGYAGTGKTTIISSLVKVLPSFGINTVLMAPTGRAAKVLAGYSGKAAFTIHKIVYRLIVQSEGPAKLSLQQNKFSNSIFLVDEASMIQGSKSEQSDLFGGINLLDDLVQFITGGENCSLILVGDSAQLPPVFSPESPALNERYLSDRFNLNIMSFELKEVVRQAQKSGILFNATAIRKMLGEKKPKLPFFNLSGFTDFVRLSGQDVSDEINAAFMSNELHQSVIICRSNKQANRFNQYIRNRVLFREDEISSGDLLMVVKNNYFWLSDNSHAGFIANGDIIEIKRIHRIEEFYGFRFASVTARMIDFPDNPDLEVKLLLNTIETEGPALSETDQNNLFARVEADYSELPKKSARLEKIRNNPHYNALQVKFAYALTCHKSQGGQWSKVFVEKGYLPSGEPDTEYLRWLYTALTRATSKVFLLNFTDEYFK
ncbi:MAG TPA: AAA family ATPase [Bacteroidales bacterium]|nr:AAA family ATPase [Bacteroidales bacterium]